MKRSITGWTTAAAAAALFALPAMGWAQTSTTGQQPPAGTAAESRAQERQTDDPAKEHLREARAALDRIQHENLPSESQQKIAELKRHFSALERSIGAHDRASATGAAERSERATEPRGDDNWQTEVAAIDRLLSELMGPEHGTAGAVGTTGATGATGATGTAGTARATIALDEMTKDSLAEVREHVTKFAAKKSGADDTHRQHETHAADTTGTMTGTAGSATAAGTTDTTAAQDQTEGQAARRHLTEARHTLSELTQLPQAAQLSGEARTQVSQLIANFNELITAQENWRATYDKVEANLEALLGPESLTAGTPTGTTGTGAAGTVGTTGAAAADLDPEVREKLVELRMKLNEFERAAGGDATQSDATDPSATAATTTAAATGTSAAPMTDHHAETEAPSGLDQGEMMRHIEAIEAILNANDPTVAPAGVAGTTGATGTAGTSAVVPPPTGAASAMTGEAVTLSRAELEQLRLHLNQLRGLVQR
jgi:hypothetical protein